MWVIQFLTKFPYVTISIALRRQNKVFFGDHENHFIGGQEISLIEIDPAFSLPNNDLPDGKAGNDILTVLKQPSLHAPLMVIKNRTCSFDRSEHFDQAGALPLYVLVMRHRVIMV